MKNSCIKSTGSFDRKGYGRKMVNGKLVFDHRIAFSKANPSIDISKKSVHHKCENPSCVNPEHLMAVTKKEHSNEHGISGIAKLNSERSHCRFGHELTKNEKTGHRVCIECKRRIGREYASKNREKLNANRKLWRKKPEVRKREAQALKAWRAKQKNICEESISATTKTIKVRST